MKLTITLEDLPNGGVFITSDPSLAELCKRAKTPGKMTCAEGYAMQAWITSSSRLALRSAWPKRACCDHRDAAG